MNNQLKLLFYIVFIVAVFFYIQDKFDFLDISLIDEITENREGNESESSDEEIIQKDTKNYVEIFIAEGESIKVDVEVADTDALRTAGLSNRKYLGDYNGMLFIYDEKVDDSFWMRDMNISLDIIFVDEFGFIVDIEEGKEPCSDTYCPKIYSSEMYKYALEVNSGFCETNDIAVGQSMVIHLASSE